MARIAVIGAGIYGALIAGECARRGHVVECIDSGPIPNNFSQSHADARAFRMAYFEAPEYVPWLIRARELWTSWHFESSPCLFEATGVLYVGSESSQLIQDAVNSAGTHGLELEVLSPAHLQTKYPQISSSQGEFGVIDSLGGVCFAGVALKFAVEDAIRQGVLFSGGETCLQACNQGTCVTLATNLRNLEADFAFVCAGIGNKVIQVNGQSPRLRVTRQVSGYWQPANKAHFSSNFLPVYCMAEPDDSLFYGFPENDYVTGVKAALHTLGEEVDGWPDPQVERSEIDPLEEVMRRRFPGSGLQYLGARVCAYESFDDGHLAVGRVPGSERIGMIASTSGHGFKFAPAIAELMVDLIIDQKDIQIHPMFDPARIFAKPPA